MNDEWKQIGDEITGVTTFEFKGIDDGEYKLVETTTPTGYNSIDDIQFTVEARHTEESDSPQFVRIAVTIHGDGSLTSNEAVNAHGWFKFDVINKKVQFSLQQVVWELHFSML